MSTIEQRLLQIEEVLVGLVQDLDEGQIPRRRSYDWALDLMRKRLNEAAEEEL